MLLLLEEMICRLGTPIYNESYGLVPTNSSKWKKGLLILLKKIKKGIIYKHLSPQGWETEQLWTKK